MAPPTLEERLEACKMHFQKSLEWKGPRLGVVEMRRHYANYFRGLPNFKPYRTRLVTVDDPAEIYNILDEVAVAMAGVEVELSGQVTANSYPEAMNSY